MIWDQGLIRRLELVTAPADEPLELADVRDDHLKLLNTTTEDNYITRLIAVVREECERYTKRALDDQTWRQVMSAFPCGRRIILDLPPLLEVTSVAYVDTDGVTQTLDTSPPIYDVVAPSGPNPRRGYVELKNGEVWPATECENDSAVIVTFRAGYIDRATSPITDNLPEDIKQGMLLAIGEFYKQRSESVIGNGATVNAAFRTARAIWSAYRVF